jgi:ArsR family transcriptional regulator
MTLETLFQALGDRTRLRLLNLMARGEVCVCFFVEVLGESQPKISRHLAYLRRAGVVGARRDGKWIHYSIVTPQDADAARVLDAALAAVANDREMQKDWAAMQRVCCAQRLPEPLQHAPRPRLAS